MVTDVEVSPSTHEFSFSITPIKVIGMRLREMVVEANTATPLDQQDEDDDNLSLGVGCHYERAADAPVIIVALVTELRPNKETSRVKRIRVVVEGIFNYTVVAPRWKVPDIIANCASILYGATRGLVLAHTGMLVGGPVILPGLMMSIDPKSPENL
jgi:preprotein translocase subunit SecB